MLDDKQQAAGHPKPRKCGVRAKQEEHLLRSIIHFFFFFVFITLEPNQSKLILYFPIFAKGFCRDLKWTPDMMMMICKCLCTKEVEEEEEEEGLISPICKLLLLLLLLLAVELKLVGRSIKIYRRMVEANPHVLEFQQQIWLFKGAKQGSPKLCSEFSQPQPVESSQIVATIMVTRDGTLWAICISIS